MTNRRSMYGLQLIRAASVCVMLAATSLFPRVAAASPLFELLGASQGSGGFNGRVTSPSAASTYFNPALLPYAETGFSLGVVTLRDDITVRVDARGSSAWCVSGACDVPEVYGGGPESFRHADGSAAANPTVPTRWLEHGRFPKASDAASIAARPRQAADSSHQTHTYQSVGLVTALLSERVYMGVYALIPLSKFTAARAFYNDEREQYFSNSLHPELYSDRLMATSLAFGAGAEVFKGLSLGVTFTLNLRNTASAPVYLSNMSNLDTVQLDSDVGVQASMAPHFGISYRPTEALSFSGTVHTKQAFEINTAFNYFLASGSEQGGTANFTHAYMPLTLGLGTDYAVGALGAHRFAVAATGTYARWSQYLDRHSEQPGGAYTWSDTVAWALGVRHTVDGVRTFFDLMFQPTPVPAQTGRSNYVDNDRVGLAGGLTYAFSVWEMPMRIGVQAQAHRLLWRHATKLVDEGSGSNSDSVTDGGLVRDEVADDAIDSVVGDPVPGRAGLQTNNPGFPGFGSSGWIYGGAIVLQLL